MPVRIGALTPVCGSLEPYDGRERPEGMQAGRKVRPQGAAGITRTAKAGEDGSILIDNSSVSLRQCAFYYAWEATQAMFGRRWSYSCWKCRATYRFKNKIDSQVFIGAVGGRCPRCGEPLSCTPLPDHEVPVPPIGGYHPQAGAPIPDPPHCGSGIKHGA